MEVKEWKAKDFKSPSKRQLKRQEKFYNKLANLVQKYLKSIRRINDRSKRSIKTNR